MLAMGSFHSRSRIGQEGEEWEEKERKKRRTRRGRVEKEDEEFAGSWGSGIGLDSPFGRVLLLSGLMGSGYFRLGGWICWHDRPGAAANVTIIHSPSPLPVVGLLCLTLITAVARLSLCFDF